MDNQHLTTLIIKSLFILSNLNLYSFSLKPLFFALPLQALVTRFSLSFLQETFICWKATNKVSPESSLLQA